jgi:hypothetical protein
MTGSRAIADAVKLTGSGIEGRSARAKRMARPAAT